MVLFLARLLTTLALLAAPAYAQQPPKPDAAKPSTTKPAAPKPAAPKPDAAKPKPAAPKTETPKPESKPDPAPPPKAEEGEASETAAVAPEAGLPVPRFVSFRTDPVNLRTGPGVRYPVDWVYMRRRLPVEIIAEFETWRQIRDADGAEGWVHQSMLSGRRTGMIKGQPVALRKTNADVSDTLAMLEPGVVIDIQRCPAQGVFCRVEVSGLQGWLKREQVWGMYPQEVIE